MSDARRQRRELLKGERRAIKRMQRRNRTHRQSMALRIRDFLAGLLNSNVAGLYRSQMDYVTAEEVSNV